MKTVTIAVALMMLTATAWADETNKQTNDPANSNESIVLGEAEMDAITAGAKTIVVKQIGSPRWGQFDTDSFTYTIEDGNGGSASFANYSFTQ